MRIELGFVRFVTFPNGLGISVPLKGERRVSCIIEWPRIRLTIYDPATAPKLAEILEKATETLQRTTAGELLRHPPGQREGK
jgi:hypothetical protein